MNIRPGQSEASVETIMICVKRKEKKKKKKKKKKRKEKKNKRRGMKWDFHIEKRILEVSVCTKYRMRGRYVAFSSVFGFNMLYSHNL